MRFVVAWFLQDRVQVDAASCEDGRERSDDAGTIFDREAYIVPAGEVRIHIRSELGVLGQGSGHAGSGTGDSNQVRHHGDRSRVSAGTVPGKYGFTAKFASRHHQVLAA